jgi:hypothetical protein
MNVPLPCQDVIVHGAMTTLVGYVLVLHVELYNISPVLIIAPVLVISGVVFLMIEVSKVSAKRKLKSLSRVSAESTIDSPVNNVNEGKSNDILPTRRESIAEGVAVLRQLRKSVILRNDDSDSLDSCSSNSKNDFEISISTSDHS